MTMCHISGCYCTTLQLLISVKVPAYYLHEETKKSSLRDPKFSMEFYIRYDSILHGTDNEEGKF
jgi:hypothetical protein